MMLKVFTLYDSKAGYFSAPFFLQSRGEAVRACIDLAGDARTTVGRHPADFVLFELGEWDNVSGSFLVGSPDQIGPVAGFLSQVRQPGLFERVTNGEEVL